jgi:hypothetical protein
LWKILGKKAKIDRLVLVLTQPMAEAQAQGDTMAIRAYSKPLVLGTSRHLEANFRCGCH